MMRGVRGVGVMLLGNDHSICIAHDGQTKELFTRIEEDIGLPLDGRVCQFVT